jgi:hypothetical protein
MPLAACVGPDAPADDLTVSLALRSDFVTILFPDKYQCGFAIILTTAPPSTNIYQLENQLDINGLTYYTDIEQESTNGKKENHKIPK